MSERRFANAPEEVGRLLVEGRLEGFRAQEESNLCHHGGRAQNERERTSERASERARESVLFVLPLVLLARSD